jgi:hypothetical protein
LWFYRKKAAWGPFPASVWITRERISMLLAVLSAVDCVKLFREKVARFGRCLRTLFCIPFGSEAFSTLSTLIACRPPRDWLILVQLHTRMRSSPH